LVHSASLDSRSTGSGAELGTKSKLVIVAWGAMISFGAACLPAVAVPL